MGKELVFLTALRSKDEFLVKRHDDYGWMDYSIKTWEYWCKQHGHDFYIFEEPLEDDLVAHRPNWQRWFKMLEFIDDYDQIMSVDASIMVKWDASDFFEASEGKFSALKSRENMKWTWESAEGYEPMFDELIHFNDFDVKQYFNSGLVILNKKHKEMLELFKEFYYEHHEMIVDYQVNKVKRGTDQPVLNYFVQHHGIDINLLPIKWGINHIHRWQVLQGNWQLKEDPTPFMIKYFNSWIFSGFSDRGITRKQLMSQVWNLVGHKYHERDDIDEILEQVKHKDTAKYTISRQFKRDILEFLGDDYKDKMGLELGTSQGQTTRILSYAFKEIWSIEIDDWNIEQAKINCAGRDNVRIIKADLYGEPWDWIRSHDVSLAFIDANHTYEGVMSDITNCLENHIDMFILDDYGHPNAGVKQAVDQLVLEDKIEIIKKVGEKNWTHLSGTVNDDYEGVICRKI